MTSAYYAKIYGTSVGSWYETTSLPSIFGSAGQFPDCAVAGGYIYCFDGTSTINNPAPDIQAFYAPLYSSGGIGTWTQTTSIYAPSNYNYAMCYSNNNMIYCFVANLDGYMSAVYAIASNAGSISSWSQTSLPNLPTTVDGVSVTYGSPPSCLIYENDIFCTFLGDESGRSGEPLWFTYYAPLLTSGIGQWTQTEGSDYLGYLHYPCGAANGYIFCDWKATTIGGCTHLGVCFPSTFTSLWEYSTISSVSGIGGTYTLSNPQLPVAAVCTLSNGRSNTFPDTSSIV